MFGLPMVFICLGHPTWKKVDILPTGAMEANMYTRANSIYTVPLGEEMFSKLQMLMNMKWSEWIEEWAWTLTEVCAAYRRKIQHHQLDAHSTYRDIALECHRKSHTKSSSTISKEKRSEKQNCL